ncbi:MAG: nuclear transport factor 2 family protein [Hyphomicrobiaceae bacterium]|nr:nuclear transport factor 2 family protein [Hyphomicrobiaceae bacterium]
MSTDTKIHAELSALNARFIHNYITRDVASHDAITHPRFVNISPSGRYWTKEPYLKYWATAFDPNVVIYWDVRDERIDIFGDTALVRATNKHTLRQNGQDITGQDITGMTTYTDTYIRENGRWLCIQAQLTTVTPEFYPSDDTIISVYLRGVKQPL